MNKLKWLISRARHSAFYLWLLNLAASRFVPFNKPHSFNIIKISSNDICIELPYKKANLNHIKGIHACALATLCEYATGIVLLASVDAAQYRIILKNINITYHYQAKTNIYTEFELNNEWIETNIIVPLQKAESIFTELKIEVYDINKNHICTGLINWQVKAWKSVRTK